MDPATQSTESIKVELGKGVVVTRSRQAGKTHALLEFVRGNDPGNTIVVACNNGERINSERRYREMYPDDYRPVFTCIGRVKNEDVLGTCRRWVTDEVWPDAVIERANAYETHEYLGGVGTPYCMDMHSK
jgi:hypothetical protein